MTRSCEGAIPAGHRHRRPSCARRRPIVGYVVEAQAQLVGTVVGRQRLLLHAYQYMTGAATTWPEPRPARIAHPSTGPFRQWLLGSRAGFVV